MVIIRKPKIEKRPQQVYMGIRSLAPFVGMSKVVRKLSDEMYAWVDEHQVKPSGPPFLRYHVIDMRGAMDIEFGFPVPQALPEAGNVKAGVLPAGQYASLVYSGGGVSGNRALIQWVRGQGLEFDRWNTEQGDNFRARYETYLTNPDVEPRKSRWHIEVAIKLAEK